LLIDFHAHFYDDAGYGDVLADTARNLGIDRLCICGGDAQYGLAANAEVRQRADSYPELFVPFAHVDLGRDGPDTVERLHRVGFAGLRVWAPPAPYDDDAFLPIYEAAEALGLPVLFHTGFLPVTPLDRAKAVRSANMRPVYLDTVARRFPRMMVIGVGLGNPWCEEATETLRHNANVLFDLSGDLLRRKGADYVGGLLRPTQSALWEDDSAGNLWGRVVFGSGVRHEEIASVERDYQRVFRALALGKEDIDAVMGNTAARLLNIAVDQ
jgi:predicted TIM-barrel fold metal-dependent hydrolase